MCPINLIFMKRTKMRFPIIREKHQQIVYKQHPQRGRFISNEYFAQKGNIYKLQVILGMILCLLFCIITIQYLSSVLLLILLISSSFFSRLMIAGHFHFILRSSIRWRLLQAQISLWLLSCSRIVRVILPIAISHVIIDLILKIVGIVEGFLSLIFLFIRRLRNQHAFKKN